MSQTTGPLSEWGFAAEQQQIERDRLVALVSGSNIGASDRGSSRQSSRRSKVPSSATHLPAAGIAKKVKHNFIINYCDSCFLLIQFSNCIVFRTYVFYRKEKYRKVLRELVTFPRCRCLGNISY